jgi:hypothetical protein
LSSSSGSSFCLLLFLGFLFVTSYTVSFNVFDPQAPSLRFCVVKLVKEILVGVRNVTEIKFLAEFKLTIFIM